jgi:RNA polymerase sigma-70 factor (ECF subfamily)
VAINLCIDWKRSFWRRKVFSLEDCEEINYKVGEESAEQRDLDLLAAVRALPANMRNVMHLHYFEGYSIPEISVILKRKQNTLYSDMNRARKRLKAVLGDSEDDIRL